MRRFSITVSLSPLNGHGGPWWLTNIYGPTDRRDRPDFFLLELRAIRLSCPGPWLICGDFNVIYMAVNKNNGRLHPGTMRRFRDLLDDLSLVEVDLSGRLFTWSNGRDRPTLVRLDWAFASLDWIEQYPSHHLRCLSSEPRATAPHPQLYALGQATVSF